MPLTSFRSSRAALVIALSVLAGTPVAPQSPSRPSPRDGSAGLEAAPVDPAGAATIRGRIVDAAQGLPLRRVIVRAGPVGGGASASAMTGDDGRYELTGLRAGQYLVTAERPEYPPTPYGERRAGQGGQPSAVRAGETLDGIDIPLSRGGVIHGRVLEAFGDPVMGASVMAERFGHAGGRQPALPFGRVHSTDDHGRFRIFGLPSGDYHLSVQLPRDLFLPARGPDAAAGDTYLRTYYPGTIFPGTARTIRVEATDELDMDLTLLAGQFATVSGTLRGAPTGMTVRVLLRPDEETGGRLLTPAVRITSEGTFHFTDVLPGSYTLEAVTASPAGLVASAPLVVAGGNATGMTLDMRPGAILRGHVVIDPEDAPDTVRPDQFAIDAVSPDDPPELAAGATRTAVNADWSFTLGGLVGVRRVQVTAPPGPGWRLQRMTLDGRDVLDVPLDFSGDVDGLEIVLTRRPTVVTGHVTDDSGARVSEYVTIVFPADPGRWSSPRFVRSAHPDQRGEYQTRNLPAGQYLAVAIEYVEAGREHDPQLLESLRLLAVPLTVEDGVTTRRDLILRQ